MLCRTLCTSYQHLQYLTTVSTCSQLQFRGCQAGWPFAGPALTSLVSWFSTSQAAHANKQEQQSPLQGKLSAIPFQVSRESAIAAFSAYHKGNVFLTQPSAGLQKVKETFLPFWATSALASVEVHRAQLGFDQWVRHYNPSTRRLESRLETVWQWITLQRSSWEARYSGSDAGMQIYASYKYPRGEIHALRPGAAMQAARLFDSSMVVSDYDGRETRRVGPFDMKPQVALSFVRQWIEGQEDERARQYIKSSFRCDRVGSIQMTVHMTGVRAAPVYVPAYIFRSNHFGTKVRTFVSGVDAKVVSGTRALDETRVGMAAGLTGAVAVLLTGAYHAMSPWGIWVWGIALPMTVAGLAAHYSTRLISQWKSYWQAAEKQRQQAENLEGRWDPAWVRTYKRLEEEARQRDEQQNAQFFASRPMGSARDPRGYYKILGLEPDCSKQEIQAAFRGLARRWHPDMHQGEQAKKEAGAKFQIISEAFQTLRDPNKRRQYDAGG